MKKSIHQLALALLLTASIPGFAQLSVSAQLRARAELRDGQGAPSADTVPAAFISQRTRLMVGYTGYRFKVYTALQDVRVWGQDASTINRTTSATYNGFMLHEAWGEISLVDTGKVIKTLILKIGRQELVYDDVRLLGNLDWLQQARRHDALLLKFEHKGWKVHLGGAFNQNAERKANTIYNGIPAGYPAGSNAIGAMYKSMQFLYASRKSKSTTLSYLLFKDDFSRYHYADADVDKTQPLYERRTWSRYTTGFNLTGSKSDLSYAASAFYQGGQYRDGTELNEYLVSASVMYAITRKLSAGAGVDITSGNNGANAADRNKRFDPLYGTPHKFWGNMDYFYVADGFGSNGLADAYVKLKFEPAPSVRLLLDVHQFALPNALPEGTGLSKNLGQEIDFVCNYTMTKAIAVEAGYSAFFATSTLLSPYVKNTPGANRQANWAYLMVSIKPEWTTK